MEFQIIQNISFLYEDYHSIHPISQLYQYFDFNIYSNIEIENENKHKK